MYYNEIKAEKPVTAEDARQLQETVRDILARVRSEGDPALRHFSKQFDRFEPESFLVPPEEAAKAKDELPPAVVEELDFAIEQVGAFAQAQKDRLSAFETEIQPGMRMGHRVVPVEAVGCYLPAGRYPCLTTGVMAVMPAKVAGVKRIIVCSSPGRSGAISPGVLYTLHKMGVDEIYCLGGVQAIGAMAYGTQTIQRVNMVVGPGNKYVAEAKRQIFGEVGIDFLAGPSECLVLADDSARADYVAADLLAQCEHDPSARGCLVTTSEKLAKATLVEIEKQLKTRTTEAVARASWDDHGRVVVVENLADAARYSNEYAPEHLEVHARDPRAVMAMLTNYGSLFLGENTPEVYADKVAGPNHILPTGAAAQYTGGMWVGMYLKVITHMEVDTPASVKLARFSAAQSTYEGMDAHRHAAQIRVDDLTAGAH